MGFTDDLEAEVKKKWPALLVGGVLTLASSLALIVWRDALVEVAKRTWSATPKEVVGALSGLLLLGICALSYVALRFHSKLKQARVDLKESQDKVSKLQDLIDNPPLSVEFGVRWSKDLIPHCPACSSPLTYTNQAITAGVGTWGFHCVKCSAFIALNDRNGRNIELSEARRLLSSSKSEPPPETPETGRPRKAKRLPDPAELRRAIESLEVIKRNLPKGDIEEKFVNTYNLTLSEIAEEVGGKVFDFFIPQSELKHRVVSQRIGPRFSRFDKGPDITYSNERYCDREVCLLAIDRAISHLQHRL